MGQVKNFGIWLSECANARHMSDEAILSAIAARHPECDLDSIHDWLLEQIRVVRTNPRLYRGHSMTRRPPHRGGTI